MGLFGRGRIKYAPAARAAVPVGTLAPIVAGGYQPGEIPSAWAPFAPGATPNVQIGRYATHIPTQVPSYIDDVQLFCGVEGIVRDWQVFTIHGEDYPYFFQQPYPQNPKQLMRDGGKPGQVFGAGLISKLLGPSRVQHNAAQDQFAINTQGW